MVESEDRLAIGSSARAGIWSFWAVVVALLILRILTSYVAVPISFAVVSTIILTLLFLGLPVWAVFQAARDPWSPGKAAAFLAGGVALHALGVVATRSFASRGFAEVLMNSIGQSGLMIWCLGLGALLTTLIRDKNLLLPVSIFLAGFDAFLIVTPTSLPQQILQKAPEVFKSVASQVPGMVQKAGEATVQAAPAVYVGPADLFFLSMFAIALFKFRMRVRETQRWVIPVLGLYLLVVLFFGGVSLGPISLGTLPALVPIGLTILLVNAKEFELKPDEKAATVVVALLALGLAGFGYWNAVKAPKRAPLGGPSSPTVVPVAPERSSSPAQAYPSPLP
jgi:hypothetical protein